MKQKTKIWNRFVVVEGIDGSGTTTLCNNLVHTLRKQEYKVESGHEPTGGPIGNLIRQALGEKIPMNIQSLALLFAADRSEHLYRKGGIRDILDSGSYYVSDRYLFSSLAYQGLNQNREWVLSLNSLFPLPSHLIYLEIPPSDAMRRVKQRSGTQNTEIYENDEFQKQVALSYENILQTYIKYEDQGMKILRLDSLQPVEILRKQVIHFIGM